MRHMHIYTAFSVSLLKGYESKRPPFVPRASYNRDKNAEIERKEIAEWPIAARERLDLTRLMRVEVLVFDFESEAYDTLLAVVPKDPKLMHITQMSLPQGSTREHLGYSLFTKLNSLASDADRIKKYGQLNPGGVSFRGHNADRLRKQARYEVIRTRKTGFDGILPGLYLATSTFDRKSVLSGKKDDTDDLLEAIGIQSQFMDPVVQDLDITLQLFRRAGLCPPVTIKDRENESKADVVDDE